MSAPIFVTDDAINEATQQVFVAELILVSSIDPATVDLTIRPSTLCIIIDNDRKILLREQYLISRHNVCMAFTVYSNQDWI